MHRLNVHAFVARAVFLATVFVGLIGAALGAV